MLLFYVRHGEPTYNPDQLTYLGHKQAEAVSKRLTMYGIDKIYSSPSVRAKETAEPTAKLLRKEIIEVPFAHENLMRRDFTYKDDSGEFWVFQSPTGKKLLSKPEVLALGDKWHTHEYFKDHRYTSGTERLDRDTDEFLLSLGYKHIRGTGVYEVVNDNPDRVALFAHHGFGMGFLSSMLDLPFPLFSIHFNMDFTGVTVVEFKNENGICYPRVLTLSDDGHLYREGLMLGHNKEVRF
ncbi:MAG: histidine phosphatase family protein [Clostridia bacterium]|nr:histidine phosphatase family protein [Clostridia bacterium]